MGWLASGSCTGVELDVKESQGRGRKVGQRDDGWWEKQLQGCG